MQKILLSIFICFILSSSLWADNLPIDIFPMGRYSQQLPKFKDENLLLINQNYQLERFINLKSHYFGITKKDQSPWSEFFIKKLISTNQLKSIYLNEQNIIHNFTNSNNLPEKIGYGINYLPYTNKWSSEILHNMQLEQFKTLSYSKLKRAIATTNLEAYAIPTYDPWFLSYTQAGEGFPFNQNLISNINLGTSLYIVGETNDKAWLLVVTPYLMGWVKATGVAYVDTKFINSWLNLANKNMIAVITPNTSLLKNNIILGSALAGTILPAIKNNRSNHNKKTVFIPIRELNGYAKITSLTLNNNDVVIMPLAGTKKNILLLISKLMGRTYGWGGFMGYNDCSAEIQAIFTPLGYFMPRNSSQQVFAGNSINLSNLNAQDKMAYVIKNAIPLMTLIGIKGHIMLYVNNVMVDNKEAPLVYQDIWGIAPPDRSMRHVIGSSVFLPLMMDYPEIGATNSIFNRDLFRLVFLNKKLVDIDMSTMMY